MSKTRKNVYVNKRLYPEYIGSRIKVWHGTAFKTRSGLRKKDLLFNKKGRIVSRRRHFLAKRTNRLVRAGYTTKKGVFTLQHKQ